MFAELDILLYCNTGSVQVKRAPGVLKKKKKQKKKKKKKTKKKKKNMLKKFLEVGRVSGV